MHLVHARLGRSTLIPVAGVLACLILQQVGHPPPGLTGDVLADVAHVATWGLIALLCLRVGRLVAPGIGPAALYTAAFGAAMATGVAGEIVQVFTGGDAGVGDVLRDGAGAIAALLLARALSVSGMRTGVILVVCSMAIAGAALAEPAMTVADIVRRNRAFPVLAGQEPFWTARFAGTGTSARFVRSADAPDSSAWTVEFKAGSARSLVIVDNVYPDWRRASGVRTWVHSAEKDTVTLRLRIYDRHHTGGPADRFERTLIVAPGHTPVWVSVDSVAVAPRGRRMDLARMQAIVFEAVGPHGPMRLSFGPVLLSLRTGRYE